MVAKRSARRERTRAINQARALIVTGPDELPGPARRTPAGRPGGSGAAPTGPGPRPGDVPGYAARVALRELGRRAQFLRAQLERLDELTGRMVTARAPGLLSLHSAGPDTAALLLIAAQGSPRAAAQRTLVGAPMRCRPDPGFLSKVRRHRLNRGGNREANHALWRIVITRLGSRPGHPVTRAYVERRTKEGLSKKEIIRCLKRYVAREVYHQLRGSA